MLPTVRFIPSNYIAPDEARYEHNILALAEGFQALGISYQSSADYWALSDGIFFIKKSVSNAIPVLSVMSHESYPFQTEFDWKNAVYIDSADGWRTPSISRSFPPFRLVLRSHYNDHYRYPAQIHPWTFGLTNRIIEAARPLVEWSDRSDSILFNFRAGHPLRSFVAENIIPKLSNTYSLDARIDSFDSPEGTLDYSYWAQTGRRHYPAYFRRLVTSKVCAAFGGYFSPNISRNLNSLAERIAYRVIFQNRKRTHTVMQWDSWRLWEGWAAGCVVMHIDFDKYGCRFPVQPQNWVHYVGFDLDNIDEDIARFLSLRDDELRQIADNGRSWAIEHYSPRSAAERFLSLVDIRD